MSPSFKRFAFGVLTAACVTLMLPLAVNLRLWWGDGGLDLAGVEAAIEAGGIAWLQRVFLLFVVGWVGAGVCLYLALSAGQTPSPVRREPAASRGERCGGSRESPAPDPNPDPGQPGDRAHRP